LNWLWITGGVLLLLAAVLFAKAGVLVRYSDDLSLFLTVAGIKFRLIPGKEKKVRPSRYSVRRIRAERKKAARKAAKKSEKKQEPEKKKKKTDVLTLLRTVGAALSAAVPRFGRYMKITVARLHVAVATGDAASTAILYGAVVQSAAYIAALLDSLSVLNRPDKADVDVHADYLSETTTADVEIGLHLRIWQIFDILFKTAFAALKARAGSSGKKAVRSA